MSSFVITNARVYHTDAKEFMPGTVTVENGKITAVTTDAEYKGSLPTVDACGCCVAPGLVDVHTHGRIGHDFDSATAEQMIAMRRSYAQDGTTTLLPTVASAPMENIYAAIDAIKEVGFDGMHLEGRYLNEKRRGAHRADLLAPLDKDELSGLLDRMEPLIVHVSCAAELEGGEAFVKTAVSRGATVGLAHTDATYEDAMNALSWGVSSFTHTFNAMAPVQHRKPGPVVAALTEENAYAEIIADGFHLAPAVVKLCYQAKRPDHLVLITDSMEATGCPDGEYGIAGQKVFVRDGKAVNEEGNIAGSTITLYTAVRNLMKFAGISLAEALPCATINPARMTGLDKITGSIEVGKRADIIFIDPETCDLRRVFCAGEEITK
ncbi:MAG: N-acetylglucosamine-6-phosphate deacetylase [Clostridia bacterium]|nr:N-acetylglucosamine-6-phosphate deacetylase [Clostridia bacterium]